MDCEHAIGIIYDYDNTRLVSFSKIMREYEDAKEAVQHYKDNPRLDCDGFYLKTAEKMLGHTNPLNLMDRRKGLMKHFNFCPDCGMEIDWSELRDRARKSAGP